MCDSSTLGVGIGTLDELAGSHTRLVIYPALAICYQRVVNPCFTQYQVQRDKVVIYPATIKQLKSHQLKALQKGLGTCILINK